MAVNLKHPDRFIDRHIGPSKSDVEAMLKVLGLSSLDELVKQTVPGGIRLNRPLTIAEGRNEHSLLEDLELIAKKNQVYKSFIGMGYSDTLTPNVILRNILQNPGWYTAYTPYQAEIAQGRLEALLNYQTMIMDLTGLEIANASLLDEGTAAAEALHFAHSVKADAPNAFFVAEDCHPQTIEVVRTRAEPLGIEVVVADPLTFDFEKKKVFGALVQYPGTDGCVRDYRAFAEKAHKGDAVVIAACDLLALTVLQPPGEWGADVAIGNTQRFGVPLGYGGPHAAFFATRQAWARFMPGRLIGVSEDSSGRPALRMALQTREQHIRRDKATSNICTAQVLLAVCASMYAVYHGPKGLKAIAERVHGMTAVLARGLQKLGIKVRHHRYFDTLRIDADAAQVRQWQHSADALKINFRIFPDGVGISLDEATTPRDLEHLLALFSGGKSPKGFLDSAAAETDATLPADLARKTPILTHPVFSQYHSETEMLRYMRSLEAKDFSLTHGMIPLGSCTMKLNATAEMIPITWPEFGKLHPFAPLSQTAGYQQLFSQLEKALCEITGFQGCSLQPNAGSQGEYAGLLVIRAYHLSRNQGHRNICLIPSSAHGTNPASAVMAGMKVVVTACDSNGNVDLADLTAKAEQYKDNLAALMVTYPSTHGVFEEQVKQICQTIHERGGQVYMDGANMNAQVGLCRPGDIGADVCHLNLHKTFCIPHGGGGPGMGPICVASHLVPFLPGHPVVKCGGEQAIGPISAAPWGSASILPISWMYMQLMGGEGLKYATEVAILNANYIAARLQPHYPVLYRGGEGRVAHECILDMRKLKTASGVEVEDIAKRLMDYGFHAPTVSFPVAGTMMVEPTESESKAELDRFIEAMIAIRGEIKEIEDGKQPKDNNVLKHAPHTADIVTASQWTRPYSREKAAFPVGTVRRHKFWPAVGRLNAVLGDRKLICACPPIEEYAEAPAPGARA